MQCGRAGAFECCPVRTRLVVYPPDLMDVTDEAAAFRVQPERIEIVGGAVILETRSLNQAYTRASLRLERKRSSHGGNVFRHVSWIHDRGDLLLMELIRSSVGRGDWKRPMHPHAMFPAEPSLREIPLRARRETRNDEPSLPGLTGTQPVD